MVAEGRREVVGRWSEMARLRKEKRSKGGE